MTCLPDMGGNSLANRGTEPCGDSHPVPGVRCTVRLRLTVTVPFIPDHHV